METKAPIDCGVTIRLLLLCLLQRHLEQLPHDSCEYLKRDSPGLETP